MAIRTFLVAALAAFAYAEKLNDCSGSCVGKAIQVTGCPSTNSHCICSSPSFMETVNECVAECTAADQEAAVSVAEGFCQAVTSTRNDLKRSKRSWGEWGQQRGGWNQPGRNNNPAPPSPPQHNNPAPPPPHGPSPPSPPNHQPPPAPPGHDKPTPPNPGPPSQGGWPHPPGQTVW